MEFKDIFRPRWKHSNPEIRLIETERMEYKAKILYEIAKNDSDPKVRVTAAKRLYDCGRSAKDLLFNAKDPEVRRVFINSRLEQYELEKIVREDTDARVKCSAMEFIDSSNSLIGINDEDASVREYAVVGCKDQIVLAKIAKDDVDKVVRAKAIQNLNNPDIQCEILSKEEDIGVHLSLFQTMQYDNDLSYFEEIQTEKLEQIFDSIPDDNSILKFVFSELESDIIKLIAIRTLKEESSLIELLRRECQYEIKSFAYAKISDKEIVRKFLIKEIDPNVLSAFSRTNQDNLNLIKEIELEKIVSEDTDASVRESAIIACKDQIVLAKIAKDDIDIVFRTLAFRKLDNTDVQCEILSKEEDIGVHLSLFQKMQYDDDLSYFEEIQTEKLKQIFDSIPDDNSILKFVFSKLKSDIIKLIAIRKLKEESSLIELLKRGCHYEIKSFAYAKISDKEIVRKFLIKETDPNVLLAFSRTNQDNLNLLKEIAKHSRSKVLELVLYKTPDNLAGNSLELLKIIFTKKGANNFSEVFSELYTFLHDDDVNKVINENNAIIKKAYESIEKAEDYLPEAESPDDKKKIIETFLSYEKYFSSLISSSHLRCFIESFDSDGLGLSEKMGGNFKSTDINEVVKRGLDSKLCYKRLSDMIYDSLHEKIWFEESLIGMWLKYISYYMLNSDSYIDFPAPLWTITNVMLKDGRDSFKELLSYFVKLASMERHFSSRLDYYEEDDLFFMYKTKISESIKDGQDRISILYMKY